MNQRVGIDKDENVTTRSGRAGIARRRNLAALRFQHLRSGGGGHCASPVSGAIIDNDDLVVDARSAGGIPHTSNRGSDP